MGAGVNENNQWEWEGNGNKTGINLGLGMGISHWQWEGMGFKKIFPLISTTVHPTSVNWIVRFGEMLKSYHRQQSKQKTVSGLKDALSRFGLPYWRKPLTVL